MTFIRLVRVIGVFLMGIPPVFLWPDGAPCLPAVLNTMDPRIASAHGGGANESAPPFQLVSDWSCYWPNSELTVRLETIDDETKFKGFAIQVFNGGTGGREGAFTRDTNSEWKYQCLFEKSAITHSFNNPKTYVQARWKTDAKHFDPIYFRATVVVARDNFFVRNVRLGPIPHCELKHRKRSECFDWDSDCWGWTRNCRGSQVNDFVRKNCQRTCNICNQEDVAFIEKDGTAQNFTEPPTTEKKTERTFTPPLDAEIPLKIVTESSVLREKIVDPTTKKSIQIPSASPPTTTTTDSQDSGAEDTVPCENTDDRCPRWAKLCTKSFYVREHCRQVCGSCVGIPTAATRNIFHGSTKSPAAANTKDFNPAGSPHVAKHFLDGISRSSELEHLLIPFEEECLDMDSSCGDWKHSMERCSFDPYVIKNCQKTCGNCGRQAEFLLGALEHQAILNKDSECHDKVPEPFCSEFWSKERCLSDPFVISNCRRTCDLCS